MDIRQVIETSLQELLPQYLRQVIAPEGPHQSDQQRSVGPPPRGSPTLPPSSQHPGQAPETPLKEMNATKSTKQLSGVFSFEVPWKLRSPDNLPKKHSSREEHDSSPLAPFSSRTAPVNHHGFPQRPTHSSTPQQLPAHNNRFSHNQGQYQATTSQLASAHQEPLKTSHQHSNYGFRGGYPSRLGDNSKGNRRTGDGPSAIKVPIPRSPKRPRQASHTKPPSGTGHPHKAHSKMDAHHLRGLSV